MPNKPILVTGCQRSGTTLLSLILDSHPQIHSIDEMEFEWGRLNEYLNSGADHSHVLFKLPSASHVVDAFGRLPDIRIIWCIRDPRDVVASMLNLMLRMRKQSGAYELPWAVHPLGAQREIEICMMTINEFDVDIADAYIANYHVIKSKAPIDRSREDGINMAAFCWYLKQEMLMAYQQRNIAVRVLFYERLISDKENQLHELLEYLGLAWHDDVLRHHKLHKGTSVGRTDNTRSIDGKSIAKWKDILGPREVDIVKATCADVAARYGYLL